MLTLRDYIQSNRVRQKDLAARLGVTQATVSRLVTGAAKPSVELAAAIKRETGGAVGFEVWVTSVHPLAASAAPTQEQPHDQTSKA